MERPSSVDTRRRWILLFGAAAVVLACWLLWAGFDALPTADRFAFTSRIVGFSLCGGSQLLSFFAGLYVGRTRESRLRGSKL